MKKYAPRKVFILENGEYIELSNEEFERRKENNPTYADRCFIPVQGFLLEVSREQYEDFYRAKERQAYLRRLDLKYGLLSIDAFDSEDDNGTDYIQAETEDVAETVAHLLLLGKLRSVIAMLPEDEKELILSSSYFQTQYKYTTRKVFRKGIRRFLNHLLDCLDQFPM